MLRSQAATGAVAVDIRGARGPNASIINGIYEPTEEVSSGWPIYRKRGDAGKWLEYFVAGKCKSKYSEIYVLTSSIYT